MGNWTEEVRGGREAATNRCVDLAISIRGHGGNWWRGSASVAEQEELGSPSYQFGREMGARMTTTCRETLLSTTLGVVGVRNGRSLDPRIEGTARRASGREEEKLSCHCSLCRVLSVGQSGTWPLCESRPRTTLACRSTTQRRQTGYCSTDITLSAQAGATDVGEKESAQQTWKGRAIGPAVYGMLDLGMLANIEVNQGIRVLDSTAGRARHYMSARWNKWIWRVATSPVMG